MGQCALIVAEHFTQANLGGVGAGAGAGAAGGAAAAATTASGAGDWWCCRCTSQLFGDAMVRLVGPAVVVVIAAAAGVTAVEPAAVVTAVARVTVLVLLEGGHSLAILLLSRAGTLSTRAA